MTRLQAPVLRTSLCVICLHDFEYNTKRKQVREVCSLDCAREAYRRINKLVRKAETERCQYLAINGLKHEGYGADLTAMADMVMVAQDIVYKCNN